jgi:hypothetical protein
MCLHMQDIRVYLRLGTTPDERYARADFFYFSRWQVVSSQLPIYGSATHP